MAAPAERDGVVRDEKTGDLIIPASQRPDGTWRKARRVKDGYIPQEEVPLFESKGTQWRKSIPTHPIGLAPDDIVKMEKAKKESSTPVGMAQVHTSKAAKKNAKRNEKKRLEKAKGGAACVSKVTESVEKIDICERVAASGDEIKKAAISKKLKNLQKKLKQIKELENRISSGELKNPDKDQLEKVSRKQMVEAEIKDIECELEES